MAKERLEGAALFMRGVLQWCARNGLRSAPLIPHSKRTKFLCVGRLPRYGRYDPRPYLRMTSSLRHSETRAGPRLP
jgi:hypothetical protein